MFRKPTCLSPSVGVHLLRLRLSLPQDVLEVGDKIKAVILGMDSDFSRISLSTADLEANHGDMITDKVCPRV